MLRSEDAEGLYAYVGETDQLRRRWAHYRSPGPSQQTNIRIAQRLAAEIGVHGAAELWLAIHLRLWTGDKEAPVDLADRATRRLFEHAWQVALNQSGTRLVNL